MKLEIIEAYPRTLVGIKEGGCADTLIEQDADANTIRLTSIEREPGWSPAKALFEVAGIKPIDAAIDPNLFRIADLGPGLVWARPKTLGNYIHDILSEGMETE